MPLILGGQFVARGCELEEAVNKLKESENNFYLCDLYSFSSEISYEVVRKFFYKICIQNSSKKEVCVMFCLLDINEKILEEIKAEFSSRPHITACYIKLHKNEFVVAAFFVVDENPFIMKFYSVSPSPMQAQFVFSCFSFARALKFESMITSQNNHAELFKNPKAIFAPNMYSDCALVDLCFMAIDKYLGKEIPIENFNALPSELVEAGKSKLLFFKKQLQSEEDISKPENKNETASFFKSCCIQ